jgi:hypothetical protein
MTTPLQHFQINLASATQLLGLARVLRAQTTPAVDVSDVLRAVIVLAVSALDHYIHEQVRVGMLETHSGVRTETLAYRGFTVPLSAVETAALDLSSSEWLNEEIARQHGFRSFQHSEKIADAMRLIYPDPLWDDVSVALGMTSSEARRRLDLIVDRRDKIAHEADLDPTSMGDKWPIDDALVQDSCDFLERLVLTLDGIVN